MIIIIPYYIFQIYIFFSNYRMRSAQVPLKVECFMIKENGIKEKIGYLLLSVRSAQMYTKGGESSIKSNWNTLLGLKSDFKTCKPELLISLRIEDQEHPSTILKVTSLQKFISILANKCFIYFKFIS